MKIPGFTGNHNMVARVEGKTNVAGVDVIHVMLDPDCHHPAITSSPIRPTTVRAERRRESRS